MAGGVTPSLYYDQTVVTVAAGTAIAAPQTTDLSFGDWVLDSVQVRVPPGPSGAVGFRLTLAGTQLVPWGLGPDWVVADDELLSFDVGVEIGQGLRFLAYNTGTYPHTLWVKLLVHVIPSLEATPVPQLLQPDAIDAAAAALA